MSVVTFKIKRRSQGPKAVSTNHRHSTALYRFFCLFAELIFSVSFSSDHNGSFEMTFPNIQKKLQTASTANPRIPKNISFGELLGSKSKSVHRGSGNRIIIKCRLWFMVPSFSEIRDPVFLLRNFRFLETLVLHEAEVYFYWLFTFLIVNTHYLWVLGKNGISSSYLYFLLNYLPRETPWCNLQQFLQWLFW